MRRREFIGLIGSAVLPLMASAQQAERMRRIGVLLPFSKDDANAQARIAAFLQELQKLGWSEGRNLQIEY
jgi:putative ABC transport system substrate-binding protein